MTRRVLVTGGADYLGCDPDRRDDLVSNERLRAAGFVARRGRDDGIRELIKGLAMLPRSPFHNV